MRDYGFLLPVTVICELHGRIRSAAGSVPRLARAGEPERRAGLVLRGFETQPVTVA
jgi:hypothetical protein